MEKVKIKLNRSLPEDFKNEWPEALSRNKKIRKGWITWITQDELINSKTSVITEYYFFPEDNKYGINFPASLFDEVKK
ncbi:hypothetical protein Phi17:1_gp3 [Cellulophaga phage phi17:1]|uniref:Uncharacterized protein n=1 Tax=Cellulophaga phage phi17:1 TaxID=1327980 RepID=R9ZY93_9CAUD|nr:hypothetical protein Phi17:1_gp3 [Cellulophaga phage phi17:1]AGO48279.1 hypothetical protein Phi17:1_gp3 [Cellulophaga phage phi17:1]